MIPDADPLRTAGCDIASWDPMAGGNPTAATYELINQIKKEKNQLVLQENFTSSQRLTLEAHLRFI